VSRPEDDPGATGRAGPNGPASRRDRPEGGSRGLRSRWRRRLRPDEIEIVGAAPTPLRDLYYIVIGAPWWLDLLGIIAVFLVVNALFALAYRAAGGIVGVDESYLSYFFFSVQTMATIGYGAMYPQSVFAHALVTCEAVVGITLVAITTGLLFSKFSAPHARVRFAAHAVITPLNGVPTLMFRLGNERSSNIVDATVRVVLTRTEHTAEGVKMYRMYDLPLERERAIALSRSWTVLHRLVPGTMLSGATPETLARDEVELTVTVGGIDEATGQALHARRTYLDPEVRWGVRHADLLTERADGGLRLDLGPFDDLVATAPTADFPYPRPGPEV
jgi:inward rectifier potassium channel